ncbi:MAG: hypothetical protein ACJASQ_002720 [Crocinitomicaceae bacterium]|jgi:hypothetical protein
MEFNNDVPAKSESDLLILDILGKNDYKRFHRILSYLGYSSPGEYLDIEAEEADSILDNPSSYFKSDLFIRHKQFMTSPAKFPVIGDASRAWRRFRYKVQEKELFEHLTFELLNREFRSMENSISYLESRVSRFRNLCNYLNTRNIFSNHYLSHMEMLLTERMNTLQSKALIESKEEINLDRIIAFPLSSSIVSFERYCTKLYEDGFISEIDTFKLIFVSKRRLNQSKVQWNGDNLTLLFVIELLAYKRIIDKPNSRSKLIVECFLNKNSQPFNEDSLNTQAYSNGLTGMNQKFLNELDNPQLKTVYRLYQEVYEEV